MIEVLSNIPFLYVVMIIASIVKPDFLIFVMIMAAFGWMGMTYYRDRQPTKQKER